MKAALMELLKGYAMRAIAGLSGWQAALASIAWKYVGRYLDVAYDNTSTKIKSWLSYQKIEKQHENDKKNAEKYDEALKNGSPSDIDHATDDLLNRNK